ncbi:MAG: chloride channel protein [Ilumatobacteraceae bacterium]
MSRSSARAPHVAGRTPVRRLVLLSALAAALGLLGGLAAFVLIRLIALLTNLARFHRVGWELPSFADLSRSPLFVVVPVVSALGVCLLARWAPEIRGHGIPEAMDAVLTNQSRIHPRTAVAKPLSAAIAIGGGGPFGAEGPIIVTGGALGSLIGQLLPMSPSERKILLGSGAAAGMAATFGTPLAAVVLVTELLLFELSTRAFVPLVVATALAAGVHSAIFGSGPLFAVPAHDYHGLDKLPYFALLGVGAGLLAVVICRGLFLVEAWYRRLPIGEAWHPVIGALIFGVVGLFEPRALGVGYDVISDVLLDRIAAVALLGLAVAKLLAWWFALGSGTSGGTLAPLLLISGAFGNLFGTVVHHVAPGVGIAPGAFALVAMAATFGAAVGATFASIVFLFELTRDYQIILPLMLASVIAEVVAGALMHETLMTEKLSRRGVHLQSDYGVDVLARVTVGEVMTTAVHTLTPTATIREARRRIEHDGHGAYPIVDETGRCLGIIAREDLIDLDPAADDEPAMRFASTDVVSVAPDVPLVTALQVLLDERIGHLPVTADGRLVGMCTRTDVLGARRRAFDEEDPQPGWHHRPRPAVHRYQAPDGANREESPVRTYLIVANQTLASDELAAAVGERIAGGEARFYVVVPATPVHDLYGSMLRALGEPVNADQSRAVAAQRLAAELERIRAAGGEADGEIGDADPLVAVAAALGGRHVDEIVVSTLPDHLSRWLRVDLPRRVANTFDRPVTHVVSSA